MSFIVDTFLAVWQSDTSQLDTGLKRSDKSADDLLDTLKKTDKQADSTGSSFAAMAGKALGALAATASVGATIQGVISKAADIAQIGQTADAIGVAVEEVDAFGKAAVALGGDAQGARDSLTDMAESIGEALQDMESGRAKTFAALGISLKDTKGNAKTAVEGILDLAGAVEGLGRSEAVFRIKELGITDNRTVEMVLKGRKELERLLGVQKEQGVLTKEQVLQAQKFNETLGRLRGALDNTATGFTAALIPAVTKILEALTGVVEWLADNEDLVIGFFVAVAAIIGAVYLPAMISAAAATLAATWPLIAIGAVIAAVAAAFALAYDDIMNFVEGNDSLIGQIFEKYPLVKDIVFAVIDAFKFMGEVIAGVWQMIITGFQQVINFVGAGVNQIASGIGKVAGFFGLGGDSPVSEGQDAINEANASPLNSTTSNSISNSVAASSKNNSLTIGELNVQTQATDAQGVAKGVGSELNSQLAQMDKEFSDGVDR